MTLKEEPEPIREMRLHPSVVPVSNSAFVSTGGGGGGVAEEVEAGASDVEDGSSIEVVVKDSEVDVVDGSGSTVEEAGASVEDTSVDDSSGSGPRVEKTSSIVVIVITSVMVSMAASVAVAVANSVDVAAVTPIHEQAELSWAGWNVPRLRRQARGSLPQLALLRLRILFTSLSMRSVTISVACAVMVLNTNMSDQ